MPTVGATHTSPKHLESSLYVIVVWLCHLFAFTRRFIIRLLPHVACQRSITTMNPFDPPFSCVLIVVPPIIGHLRLIFGIILHERRSSYMAAYDKEL